MVLAAPWPPGRQGSATNAPPRGAPHLSPRPAGRPMSALWWVAAPSRRGDSCRFDVPEAIGVGGRSLSPRERENDHYRLEIGLGRPPHEAGAPPPEGGQGTGRRPKAGKAEPPGGALPAALDGPEAERPRGPDSGARPPAPQGWRACPAPRPARRDRPSTPGTPPTTTRAPRSTLAADPVAPPPNPPECEWAPPPAGSGGDPGSHQRGGPPVRAGPPPLPVLAAIPEAIGAQRCQFGSRGDGGRSAVPEAMVVGPRPLLPRESGADRYRLGVARQRRRGIPGSTGSGSGLGAIRRRVWSGVGGSPSRPSMSRAPIRPASASSMATSGWMS
jgi:hypothetical protein